MNDTTRKTESGLELKEFGFQPVEEPLVDENSQWSVEDLIEQIWRDLGGAKSHSHIRSVLREVAPEYENARIKIFVPILLRRDVLQRLQDELELDQGANASSPENAR